MDLKPVMPGLSQPNRMETALPNAAIFTKDTAMTGDILTIGVDRMLKGLLVKTAALLDEQEALLQSLPSQVRTAAEQILHNSLPDISTLSAGLVPLLNTRRLATDSLVQLAQKLQLVASALQSNPDKPAELVIESNRFAQQVKSILAQLDLDAKEIDPAVLQQARDQIQSAASDTLRQAATKLAGQKPASTGVSTSPLILQAANKLNLPELPQLWLLTDTDIATLTGNTPSASLEQNKTSTQSPTESDNPLFQTVSDNQGQEGVFTFKKVPFAKQNHTSVPAKPAELLIAIKRFAQQVNSTLAQLDRSTMEVNSAVLQQARDEIQTAIPDILRHAAVRLAAKPSSSDDASIPLAIRQAADKLNLPELQQLWPLYDRKLVTLLESTPPATLEQHAATVRSLAESVNRAFQTVSDDQGQSVLFTLQMPFNGESAQPRPVHIHVFREKGQTKNDGSASQSDTWVRLTLQPEHTGQVDTIFHLYGEDILDIKVAFVDKQASLLFNETVPLLREACSEFPFMLREVSIS